MKSSHLGAPDPKVEAAPAASLPFGLPQDTHLLDRLSVLHKYRRIVTAVFVLVLAWFMVQSYTTTPLFRAVAQIEIDEDKPDAGTPVDIAQSTYGSDPELYFNTQHRVLRSRDLARRVVSKLDLSQVPEFNGRGPTPTPLQQFFATANQVWRAPLAALFPPDAPVIDPPAVDESVADAGMIDAIIGRIEVVPVRGSHLVDVAFTSADRAFAAQAANIVVEEYVSQNLELKVGDLLKTLDWLTGEVARQQKLVLDSERRLSEYREQQDAGALADNQNIVVARLGQLNDAVMGARTTRIEKQEVWNQVQQAGTNRDLLAVIIQSPAVQELRNRLQELQRERAALAARYGELHPSRTNNATAIDNTERQYNEALQKAAASARSEYEAAMAQERSLMRELDSQKVATTSLNRKGIDYSVMQRETETYRNIYNTMLQRERELRVVANSRSNNVRVVDRAEVPGGPFTPNHRTDWTYALLFAMVISFGIAFGLDYLDDTIKTPEDITRRLRLRFLGLVPSVPGERYPLLSGPVPHDFGESFRALRTSLVGLASHDGPKVLAVTSAQPLEGKTTTAVNIAMALAVGGSRVLLIDADMRRPNVHKTLRISNDRGLSTLLAGQSRMREVVQRTHDPNLLVIPAGRTPANPSELLASERMRALVEGLESGPFEWVIIDTPPVLAVTDAVIVAPMVSGVTFVIGADMTRWRLAQRAVEMLQSANPRAMAAVLNKVDFARNRYYYSRYYGHQYKSYYSEAPAA
ncbi:MAG TPA: polysaccharide biosynthesis tyrosine autokinase [Vicinamibacterales bacterium]|nr:polysaccharide biosynthesis tyrosine autokinase [Vicinamibacterales bacterium]